MKLAEFQRSINSRQGVICAHDCVQNVKKNYKNNVTGGKERDVKKFKNTYIALAYK